MLLRLLSVLCALFFPLSLLAQSPSPSPSPLENAWKDASLFLFQDALKKFQTAKASSPRLASLGEALSLLGIQPKTQKNLARAIDLFSALVAENPSDDTGIAARFYLARIDELHRSEPDLPAARQQYLDLLYSATGSTYAEISASRIALIDLSLASPSSLSETTIQLQSLQPLILTSLGKREFHTTIGLALNQFHGDSALILHHLLLAAQEPFSLKKIESDVIFTIASIAQASNDLPLASRFYSRFLSEFPQDIRTFFVKKRLEEISSQK